MALPSILTSIDSVKTLGIAVAIIVIFSGYIYAADKEQVKKELEQKADLAVMNQAIEELKKNSDIQRETNKQFQDAFIELMKQNTKQQVQIEHVIQNQDKVIKTIQYNH